MWVVIFGMSGVMMMRGADGRDYYGFGGMWCVSNFYMGFLRCEGYYLALWEVSLELCGSLYGDGIEQLFFWGGLIVLLFFRLIITSAVSSLGFYSDSSLMVVMGLYLVFMLLYYLSRAPLSEPYLTSRRGRACIKNFDAPSSSLCACRPVISLLKFFQ